ncbi:hypothetical protein JCM30760_10040 [Thiomicrorhabdus hydrogeniphila]
MKNGFIYPMVDSLVKFLYYCNLVELFKYIGRYYTHLSNARSGEKVSRDDLIQGSNIAIDIFQVSKWVLLIYLWVTNNNSTTSFLIIAYLMFTNLFTYFYYHVWGSKFSQRLDKDTLNRKFVNFLLAVSFYLACYAYLYHCHYSDFISWPDGQIDWVNATYLSVSTTFTLTYGGFSPLTQQIRIIFMTELVTTFLFLAIIISNSVPNHAQHQANQHDTQENVK